MKTDLRTKISRTKFFFYFLLFFFIGLRSQVISQFDWNSNPVTLSVTGPTATSSGLSATSSAGGAGGTNGLNPGAPTANDINLNIPNTGGIFDIPNIDVRIDYRRNESTATMVRRGVFTFNNGSASANFQVVFRVNNGAGATTITSTVYPIPLDANFRTYRFTYDNCSGVGTMYVNNTLVWSSPTPTVNQNLYWVGDGNFVIGQDMDGANNNIPNLDNFILQPYGCNVILPIQLTNFTGRNEGNKNVFNWTTATEKNNDFFTLEKSTDGFTWQIVARQYGAGNSNRSQSYSAEENDPGSAINYYRLMQTDYDGHWEKFTIISIDNTLIYSRKITRITDLLGREISTESEGPRLVYYSDGKVEKQTSR